MRKHCSNVCKFRPCLATVSTNSAHMQQYRHRSAAEAIFANGTYFLDNPRTWWLSGGDRSYTKE